MAGYRKQAATVAIGLALIGGAVMAAPAAAAERSNDVREIAEQNDTHSEAAKPKRKPTLLPAAKRRTRSSAPPPPPREDREPPRRINRAIVPAPLPPARDVPGDRGPPLGVPPQYDPRWTPATPPIGTPPLPPARQVPGETGIPLGPSPLSPVR